MSKKYSIIITGKIQIQEKHLDMLKANDISWERLPNNPSEEQLCNALPGKDGYILGSIEKVTEKVIDAGNKLRAICTTAVGWKDFILAHKYATQRGIAITSAAGGNAQAVAELTVGFIIDRVRHISYLSGEGIGKGLNPSDMQGHNLRTLTLGIIGAGNIGSKVARMLNHSFGTGILYSSPEKNLDLEYSTGAVQVPIERLLGESNIVSLHTSRFTEEDAKDEGKEKTVHLINRERMGLLKDGAILINTSFIDAIDPQALYDEVSKGRISAAVDWDYSGKGMPDFSKISSRYLIRMGIHSGYNTAETVPNASDLTTRSMINLLTMGDDKFVVNPKFKNYLKV